MKKSYVKPGLFAESFVMSEHIAAGCKVIPGVAEATYITSDTCAFVDGNLVVYIENTTACKEMDLGLFETVDDLIASVECYNAFSTMDTMFVS